MIEPLRVEPRAGYTIWIRYSDGTEGEIDLSHLAGRGVFALWDDRAELEKVHVGPGRAIAWSDQVELCPDALYLRVGHGEVIAACSRRDVDTEPSHRA